MKLLYVVNTFEYFVSHRLALAQAAIEQGWEVHLASPPSRRGASLAQHRIVHHPLDLERKGLNPLRELRAFRQLGAIYSAVRPDLLHVIGPKALMYGGLQARLKKLPALVGLVPGMGYIFLLDGLKGRFVRALGLWGYRIGLGHPNKRLIFQNPEDREYFIRNRVCTKEEARLVLGSGVDLRAYPPSAEPQGDPVVLYASRFLREKGVALFAGAARRLRREGIRARFALVGAIDAGNPSSVGQAEVEAWVGEGIENWGYRDDMPEALRSCHIFCLPTYRREGIPKILIEAAAAGRPIVTTDMPGCREVVQDGSNGLLVPPRDEAALAEAIGRLLRDPELRSRMGTAARARAEAEFSLPRVIRQTLAVYSEVAPARDPGKI